MRAPKITSSPLRSRKEEGIGDEMENEPPMQRYSSDDNLHVILAVPLSIETMQLDTSSCLIERVSGSGYGYMTASVSFVPIPQPSGTIFTIILNTPIFDLSGGHRHVLEIKIGTVLAAEKLTTGYMEGTDDGKVQIMIGKLAHGFQTVMTCEDMMPEMKADQGAGTVRRVVISISGLVKLKHI